MKDDNKDGDGEVVHWHISCFAGASRQIAIEVSEYVRQNLGKVTTRGDAPRQPAG